MTEIDRAALEAAERLSTSPSQPTQIARISHRVYLITTDQRTLVLKLFQPESTGAFRRELDGANAAATAVGSWVPHLTASGTLQTGHHYIARDAVIGTSLHAAVELAEVNRADALQLVGTALCRFHQTTRTGFGAIAAPTATSAPDLMTSLADERASLLVTHDEPRLAATLGDLAAKLAAMLADRTEAILCHGDLHLRNVIIATAGRPLEALAIVDYESVIFAFPEYDFAKTVVVCSAFTDQDRQALLTGYGRDIDETVFEGLLAYHAIDGWLWAALDEQRDRELWASRLQAVFGTPPEPMPEANRPPRCDR